MSYVESAIDLSGNWGMTFRQFKELMNTSSERPTWDQYFSLMALLASSRAACSRRKVGAVIVKDNRVLSSGYNGTPPGDVNCSDGGCPRGSMRYEDVPAGSDYNQFPCRGNHAELNAIIRAGFSKTRGGTLYVTDKPCQQCRNAIDASGIVRVVVPVR